MPNAIVTLVTYLHAPKRGPPYFYTNASLHLCIYIYSTLQAHLPRPAPFAPLWRS